MRRWFTSPAVRPFWLLVMLVVLWDVTIRLAKIPPYLIPPPLAVAKQLFAEWPMLPAVKHHSQDPACSL